MCVIVISKEYFDKEEPAVVRELFDAGLETFHLRKPDFSQQEVIDFLESIEEPYRNKIVLHSHFYLAKDFNVKGLHYKSGNLGLKTTKMDAFTHSASCHTEKEIKEAAGLELNYAFLSPVYESISKNAYKPNLTSQEMKDILDQTSAMNIIALGGIDEDRIEQCMELGFDGVAVLGALWQSDDPVEKFKRIQEQCLKYATTY